MQWYEPYYLWRRFFLCKNSEVWLAEEFNEKARRAIEKEHDIFLKKSRKKIIVEKMPSHAFNVKYILKIFPEAKWIHILRDGRDIALSMKKELKKRREIIQNKDYLRSFETAYAVLKRAPYFRYKMMLALHELKSNFSLNPSKYLNKAKWKGKIGWGPRFEGWEKCIEEMSTLQFNAMQWVESVSAVLKAWPLINENNKLEIRYEALMENPRETLSTIFEFLELDCSDDFFQGMPALKTNNFDKWRSEFTVEEIEEIKPILTPLISELGYGQKFSW